MRAGQAHIHRQEGPRNNQDLGRLTRCTYTVVSWREREIECEREKASERERKRESERKKKEKTEKAFAKVYFDYGAMVHQPLLFVTK